MDLHHLCMRPATPTACKQQENELPACLALQLLWLMVLWCMPAAGAQEQPTNFNTAPRHAKGVATEQCLMDKSSHILTLLRDMQKALPTSNA
eukprot:1159999-Pelagomonas_calceolata.AAC.9